MNEENTRDAVLRIARALLVREGLKGISMRKVAAECGLSATAIYRHFSDKDALLASAVLEAFRAFGSYLLGALEKPTPRARFWAIGERYFDFAREHSHEYQLIFMTNCAELGLSKLDETSHREISSTFQMLQDRIAECQMEGSFGQGDPRQLAASVWASVHGLASLMITGNIASDPKEREVLINQHLTLIELSLQKHPGTREAP